MESRKQLQTASTIQRSFGSVLSEHGMNIYGKALVTVTSVKVTPDLSQAKIYLSIYNVEDKNEVLGMINFNKRILKNELVRKIRRHVRRIPDISMFMDETIDEMYRVDNLFQKLYNEKQMGEEE